MTTWLVLAVHKRKKKKEFFLHLSAVNCNEEGGRACTSLYCFELSPETLSGTTHADIFSWLLNVISVVV